MELGHDINAEGDINKVKGHTPIILKPGAMRVQRYNPPGL